MSRPVSHDLPPHVREEVARLDLGALSAAPVERRRLGRAVGIAVFGAVLVVAPLLVGWRGWALVLGVAMLSLPGVILLAGAGWGTWAQVQRGPVTAYPFERGLVVACPRIADDRAAARWEDIALGPPDPRHPGDVRLQVGEGRPRTVPPALFPVLAAHLDGFEGPEAS